MERERTASAREKGTKGLLPRSGRNKIIILAASAVLLTAFVFAAATDDGQDGGWSMYDEIPIGDSELIYRIIYGSAPGTFSAERHNGDETWGPVTDGTDVPLESIGDAILNDAEMDDCLVIFWGDGARPINTLFTGEAMLTFSCWYDEWNVILYGTLSAETAWGGAVIWMYGYANITSYAYITNAGYGTVINSFDYGTLDIMSGAVMGGENGAAIITNWGDVNIYGGTVSATGEMSIAIGSYYGNVTVYEEDPQNPVLIAAEGVYTIMMYEGLFEMHGGTVTNTMDDPFAYAIRISKGEVRIHGGTVESIGFGVSGWNTDIEMTGGTVKAAHVGISDSSGGNINISGGTVEGYYAVGFTFGEINISGGTVKSGSGYAVYIYSYGKVTISEADPANPTLITSAGEDTVMIQFNANTAKTVLEMTGGTVTNTSGKNDAAAIRAMDGSVSISGGTVESTGIGIYSEKFGDVNISGGKISAGSYSVYKNAPDKKINLDGTPEIYGAIYTYAGPSEGQLTVAAGFAPGSNIYSVEAANPVPYWVAVTFGAEFIDSFVIVNDGYTSAAEADDLVLVPCYIVTVNIHGNGEVYVWMEDRAAFRYTAPFKIIEFGSVTLTASAGTGYEFIGWTGGIESDGSEETFTVSSDMSVTATFALKKYAVTVTANNISGDVPPTIWHGSTLTFTFVADAGYILPASVAVSMDGTSLTQEQYAYDQDTGDVTIPNVIGDVNITASGIRVYTVTFDPNNGDVAWYVTVPEGTPVPGTKDVTRNGWSFLGWFAGDAQWEFGDPVTNDMTLTARWAEAPPGEDEDGDDVIGTTSMSFAPLIPAALAAVLLAMLLPFLLARRRPKIIGTVTQDGKPFGGAEIAYTADGSDGKAVTDADGGYVIPAAIGSEVVIVSVGGRSVSLHVTPEKRVTELDIGI